MSLGTSGFLLLLIPVVMAALLLLLWLLWRGEARRRFGARMPSSTMSIAAPALLLLAGAIAAFAAARPQFGENTTVVERRGIDLVIVLDISQSMLATDTEPSRLSRAQDEISALLDRLTGDRAGLVIFAGEPFVRSPLTADLVALRELTQGVHIERGLVSPGSDLGAAIDRGSELLESGTADTKAMLIVSDGEDHGGAVDTAITAATFQGVRVYTAGAGTAEGATVLDADAGGILRPRVGPGGAPVVTRLDAEALRGMAATGGGRYIELGGGGELAGLAGELESLESTAFDREESSEPIERFQLFAAIALVTVLVATVLAAGTAQAVARRAGRLLPVAGAGLMIAAICGTDAAEWNRRGNRQFNGGEYDVALESYRRGQELSPEERALYYNRANAFAALGEYVSAIDEAQRALPVDDPALEAIIEYSLGNHYANNEQLREALEAYRRSLFADPGGQDAKANYEIVERLLTPAAGSPTPTPPAEEPASPEPGDDPQGGSTPEPGAATPGTGTPQSGGTPAGAQQLPPEELQRLLEEALAGIDDEFTVEEALRVLELLEEQNRGQIDDPPPGSGGLPDY